MFNTRETVAVDTPASFATSVIFAIPFRFPAAAMPGKHGWT
jgi:hypothetical protein